MLSNNNKVFGVLEASTGGKTGTIVDLRIIFSALLKANATVFLIVHYLKLYIMYIIIRQGN